MYCRFNDRYLQTHWIKPPWCGLMFCFQVGLWMRAASSDSAAPCLICPALKFTCRWERSLSNLCSVSVSHPVSTKTKYTFSFRCPQQQRGTSGKQGSQAGVLILGTKLEGHSIWKSLKKGDELYLKGQFTPKSQIIIIENLLEPVSLWTTVLFFYFFHTNWSSVEGKE